ncbi:VOC family protein [Mucilaginibacter terrenus]|uniref:VOC family protein n=1 Tax=Mucilaginibacter terrenus TaxID=2482727 RepID=A0A3E2NVE9_9SPHI|nr:VOC family protein [Mucilaginibacter terrenus]RFZ84994.1 VOC family protein [Mucilaginibacter terrenus]
MKITITSVLVDNQDRALEFYTEKLGFAIKHNVDMGEFKWLTVISPEGHDDVELLLEPNANPASKDFQAALFQQGIPATMFNVEDTDAEYERLKSLGVEFKMPPTQAGPVKIAILNDTCGNWIQIYQQ